MQVICLNRLVEDEPKRRGQETFSLPELLEEPLDPLWQRIGVKNKWQAYTAAILAFYRLSEDEQDAMMSEVVIARRKGDFRRLLVEDVGETRDEAKQPDRQRERDAKGGQRPDQGRGRSGQTGKRSAPNR